MGVLRRFIKVGELISLWLNWAYTRCGPIWSEWASLTRSVL